VAEVTNPAGSGRVSQATAVAEAGAGGVVHAAGFGDTDTGLAAALSELLLRSHLAAPDELPGLVARAAEMLGSVETVIHLVDYEQRYLVPLPPAGAAPRDTVTVDATLAGRVFRILQPAVAVAADGPHLWVPLLDGVNRLGVVEFVVPDMPVPLDPEVVRPFLRLTSLTAELVLTTDAYTDVYQVARRRKPMGLPAELQYALLPPLTFGTDRLVLSGFVAPTYDVGGDAFDYALNGDVASVAVFDAMGHGLAASMVSALAVACYRNSRRSRLGLVATVAGIDAAVGRVYDGERFATALVGELDIRTGAFRWVNAGHPPATLLRGGQLVKELVSPPALPLGLNGALTGSQEAAYEVGEESLQPGDRLLLVTDGVAEARTQDGEFFGPERLADFASRELASGLPTPEVLRRLQQAILRHQDGHLQDDATAVLVQWLTGHSDQLLP